jgi:hypothetical protein
MRTFFDIKKEELKNPKPANFSEDLPWNPLSPRREVIEAYNAVSFQYEPTLQDRVASKWYALVKGRPEKITQEITQFYRRKIPQQGDFIFYNVMLYGEDWKGNEHDLTMVVGKYQMPVFKKERNPETDKVTTTEVMDHKTVYDIKWSKEIFDNLLESATEPVSLIVYGSAGRRLGISSMEDYREGATEDLVECGTKGKSLATILAERNQFIYEKREHKQQQPSQK